MLTEGYVLNHRYQILRVLSDKGGMGVIYQATDLSFNNTVVIKNSRFTEQFLKQQHPTMPADDLRSHAEYLRKAFAREANLLRRLEHPALPPVIDYFMTGDGQQFFVMNFVPGKDLSELLTERLRQQQGPFQLGDVLGWAEQLLATLDYLHTRFESPIIHRDIKPANLKLRPDGQIKLLDFGLAKGAAPEMSVVDRSIAGYTPQYAPLEQMRREGTDARSDLYSLAVTLHHLLTGHEPPEAVVRASEAISRRPDPLRPAHELNPQVPSAISALLQRAAALNPDERPATAAEMREALRHASQAEPAPTTAKPPDQPAAPTITDQPTSPGAPVSVAPSDQGAASQPAGTTDLKWEPPHSTPDNPSAEAFTIERPRPQPAAPTAEPLKVDLPDQPTKPRDIGQPHSNRGKYAAAGVVLALAIGLVMFLNRNSSAPTNASSEAKPLSLAPTPTSTVADSLQSFTEDLGKDVKLEMVAIPGGTFEMGSNDGKDDEKPKHQVKVDAFAIGKYEVTQAQWQVVMGNNPSTFKDGNSPVENVSWNEAVQFCQRLSQRIGKSYRLLTEAEWEYAARANTTTKFYFGNDESLLNQYAWYSSNSEKTTHTVGQKKPNAWGLYDMYGNVWEWCQDWHDPGYYKQSPGISPLGPPSGKDRVVRGSSWNDDYPIQSHSSRRGSMVPHWKLDTLGFRLAGMVRNR